MWRYRCPICKKMVENPNMGREDVKRIATKSIYCPHCNGRKKELHIDPELCKGCGKCMRQCPMEAISGQIRMPHVIDTEKCIKCGACWGCCPFGAIREE